MNRGEWNRNSEKIHFGPPAEIATEPLFGSKSGGVLDSPQSRSLILELPDADFFELCQRRRLNRRFSPLQPQTRNPGPHLLLQPGTWLKFDQVPAFQRKEMMLSLTPRLFFID
jgi:hypothetical protein